MVQQSWCHCSATLDTVESNAKFQEEKLRVMSSGIFTLQTIALQDLSLRPCTSSEGRFRNVQPTGASRNFEWLSQLLYQKGGSPVLKFAHHASRHKLAGLHNLMWDFSIKGKDERAAATRPTDQCSLDTPLGPATTACSESRSSKATSLRGSAASWNPRACLASDGAFTSMLLAALLARPNNPAI